MCVVLLLTKTIYLCSILKCNVPENNYYFSVVTKNEEHLSHIFLNSPSEIYYPPLQLNIYIGALLLKAHGGDFPMESENMRRKIEDEIEHTIASPVIKNKRFLEDEQLIKSEQLEY